MPNGRISSGRRSAPRGKRKEGEGMSGIEGNRREFMLQLAALSQADKLVSSATPATLSHFENSYLASVIEGSHECLWKYRVKSSGWEYCIAPPVFNIDGERVEAALSGVKQIDERRIPENGVVE